MLTNSPEYYREASRRYRERNRDKVNASNRERMRRSYHANPEARARRIASAQRWREKNPGKVKLLNWTKAIRRKYGITPAQYDAMLQAQGGACALCGKTNKCGKRLAVDHIHATGVIRGLLCDGCNRGVGRIEYRAKSLFDLVVYLGKARAI